MPPPPDPSRDPDRPAPDPAPPRPRHHEATEGERKLDHGTADGGADTARTSPNGEVVPRPGLDGDQLDAAVRETPANPADRPDPDQ